MTIRKIIHFDEAVSSTMLCIPAFSKNWDNVTVSDLETIKQFLSENYPCLKQIIFDDIRENYLYMNLVKNIYNNLQKYSSWYYGCSLQADAAKVSDNEEDRHKAAIAEEVYIAVEVQWKTFILMNYPPMADSEEKHANLPTIEEFRNQNKDAENRASDTDLIYSFFIGNFEEKEKRLKTLRDHLNGKKGKEAALIELAAEQLGWITKPLPFKLLQTYFGVEGGAGAIGNYYTQNKKDLFSAKELKRAKLDLMNQGHPGARN